jgi:succinyl-CoA synthetase beta subunit
MDIIKLSGGNPANFLDVGGTADAQRVQTAFGIILTMVVKVTLRVGLSAWEIIN